MKRKNLEILRQHKFNVPKFDVVTWEDRDKEIDITNFKGKYAVRSSSYLEDGENDSFAGQFDTFLNVKSNNINRKVKQCFDSINKNNVKDYLKKKKIKAKNFKMDVIIQEMVDSEYSGIIFTSNPQGLLNETVIVVGKGLGNKIVEDKIKTTTYYYNKTDSIYYYEGKKDYLNKDTIERLIKVSEEINKVLGEYLDIEFAVKKNEIYILQARPITTIDDSNLVILDNSNIVESYPGVSLPLTISFVHQVYTDVFKNLCYRISKNKELVEKNKNSFNNMVASSNGRLYYKISSWYTLIKFLPFSKKIIPIWQDMLGVKNKEYDNSKLEMSFASRIKLYFNTFKELFTVPKNMDKLNTRYLDIHDYFYSHFHPKMSNKETLKLYEKVREDILSMWDITLVNDLYSFIFTGLLKKRLAKKNLSAEYVNEYISGISNIESLKPIKNLINLAYKKDKVSKQEYKELFENYINEFGDRSLEELKLESITFRTDPKTLERKIKEYRKDKSKLETIYNDLNNEKKVEIKEDFITKFISKRAVTGIKNREISRLNRSRIYGMVRLMMLQIGKNYVKSRQIRKKEDIFYLTLDEIFSNKKVDYKKIVNQRKKEYSMYYELPNYTRLIFTDKEFDKAHKRVNKKEKDIDSDILEGIPTSNGIVEGEALVIENINKKYDVKNKILITKMTDPGWVFLLVNSKGVISEKGSLLSHTAIISREIKIPSIVGVEDATTIIKTGDYLKMDATTGRIEILKRRRK